MQKRTEGEWRELAKEYQDSGLSQKVWCKLKEINHYTFRDRLTRLRKSEAVDNKTLKPGIKAKEHDESAQSAINWLAVRREAESSESGLRIEAGGFTIKVAPGFDESSFLRVCRILSALC